VNNGMRSLSFAVAGVGFLALLASALFFSQTHGPKEQTGPTEKPAFAISTDMSPVLVKSPGRKVFQGAVPPRDPPRIIDLKPEKITHSLLSGHLQVLWPEKILAVELRGLCLETDHPVDLRGRSQPSLEVVEEWRRVL